MDNGSVNTAVLVLLKDIDTRDIPGLGVTVEPSAARTKALKLGLIHGRRMKIGHRKIYLLTNAGREFLTGAGL